jgi:uncharacterized protein
MKSDQNADYWINHLDLTRHPEGGFFREVYRSEEIITSSSLPERFSGNRNFSSSIYYLLRSGEFSSFHKIKSDEIWHFYNGSAIILHVIAPGGAYSKILLGKNVKDGECLQYAVPFGHWFSAEVKDTGSFSLAGCTVAPGFDFADSEMGTRKHLIELFPFHFELIERLAR